MLVPPLGLCYCCSVRVRSIDTYLWSLLVSWCLCWINPITTATSAFLTTWNSTSGRCWLICAVNVADRAALKDLIVMDRKAGEVVEHYFLMKTIMFLFKTNMDELNQTTSWFVIRLGLLQTGVWSQWTERIMWWLWCLTLINVPQSTWRARHAWGRHHNS